MTWGAGYDARVNPFLLALDPIAVRQGKKSLGDLAMPDGFGIENRELLLSALNHLPVRDRALLIGVLGEERSVGEVAAQMQMSPAAASRRLYKVKGRLRSQWIQGHIDTAGAPGACRPYLEEAGIVLANLASPEREERFWEHVRGCDFCTEAIAGAQAASRRFGVSLATVLLLADKEALHD